MPNCEVSFEEARKALVVLGKNVEWPEYIKDGAWAAADKDGGIYIYTEEPTKKEEYFDVAYGEAVQLLPEIFHLGGLSQLTFETSPIEKGT